jgi:hypothetical protein
VFTARGFTTSSNNLSEYPISICEPAHLTTGQHQISASWLPNDGKSYAYKWTFDTDAVLPVDTGEGNINLLVQYDIWRENVIDN